MTINVSVLVNTDEFTRAFGVPPALEIVGFKLEPVNPEE